MDHPFPKSTTTAEKCRRLAELVRPEDTLGIVISADPDAIGSALALRRFFWRKVRRTIIYHLNPIMRADNLALLSLLKLNLKRVKGLDPSWNSRWALLDSQPHHLDAFEGIPFDIIIDHHPVGPYSQAHFVDVREQYGATSTMLVEYLRTIRVRPSPRLATALFYGIKTDTDNFVRECLPNDLNAFRYLYPLTNMNIVKKIEASEMTKHTLASFRKAMDRLTLYKDIAFVHMGEVDNPDLLVIIADFFMKLAEARWSVVSGIYGGKLVVIFRNAGLRADAGKAALRLFAGWSGTAGGHRSAARAEIPLEQVRKVMKGRSSMERFLLETVKQLKKRGPISTHQRTSRASEESGHHAQRT